MRQKAKEWSPRAKARLAGVFETLEGLTSAFGQVNVLGGLIVVGNATATSANILKHETLFRYMSPPLGHYLFPIIAVASGLAEIPLQLWLLIFGVNNERWKAQAEGMERSNSGRVDRAGVEPAKHVAMRLPLFI